MSGRKSSPLPPVPPRFVQQLDRAWRPLAQHIASARGNWDGLFIVGLSGAQGSGKSTIARLLVTLLKAEWGLKSATVSLDDFYLTRSERQSLARSVHALFATRGVPGTHDVPLAISTLGSLRRGIQTPVPVFSKACDDREPSDLWPRVNPPLDVLVLEGWCLGAKPQSHQQLEDPINALEREQDRGGVWRRAVNDQLVDKYPALFAEAAMTVFLRAPSFEKAVKWRIEQEFHLKRSAAAEGGGRPMSVSEVGRFAMHFERLTRHMLVTMPDEADVVISLAANHHVERIVARLV